MKPQLYVIPSGLLTIAYLMLILAFVAGVDSRAAETPDSAPNAPLNEQVIRVLGEYPPAVVLQVTIFHPNGNGPFPLAIMNHGATDVSPGNRGQRYRLTNAAFYFLSRGYAVALPMMRGFAASDGDFYHFGCDFSAMGIANATDIRAVIRTLGADPRIDSRRVVVAGQSLGGWNTLALGTLNIPNVQGLINFNGGIRASDCDAGDPSLVAGAEYFGIRTRIPSIWFYGENDTLLPVHVWRAMYDRYTRNGGQAELVDVGVVMKNSHRFLSYPEALPLWIPKVDAFLARIGMPSAMVNPEYLPLPFPPATQFALLTDVAAIPYVSDKGRDSYRGFLDAPFPRAFVISETGEVTSVSDGLDPLGRALSDCQKSTARCGVYAVDDHVVWTAFSSRLFESTHVMPAKADGANSVTQIPPARAVGAGSGAVRIAR